MIKALGWCYSTGRGPPASQATWSYGTSVGPANGRRKAAGDLAHTWHDTSQPRLETGADLLKQR